MKSIIPSIVWNSSNLQPGTEVFGVSGSPRKNGNSDILLQSIISGISHEKIPANYLNLAGVEFKGCIGCEKCRKDKICTGLVDGMSVIYNRIISAKGLVLVSPTHNYNVTSWMKAFIDRLYCFYTFENNRPGRWSSQLGGQGRKAVVATICEQETGNDMGFTMAAMKKPLAALGYEIIGELSVFGIFDKAKVQQDQEAVEKAFELGKKLAQAIRE